MGRRHTNNVDEMIPTTNFALVRRMVMIIIIIAAIASRTTVTAITISKLFHFIFE
jgi:hypothetical protein